MYNLVALHYLKHTIFRLFFYSFSAPSEPAMKSNSIKSSRQIEEIDSQPDQSAAILKMLVSAVLEMDARMKRMEAMLEILTLKAEK